MTITDAMVEVACRSYDKTVAPDLQSGDYTYSKHREAMRAALEAAYPQMETMDALTRENEELRADAEQWRKYKEATEW